MNEPIKYKDYQIEDYLLDEFFIQWVKYPNKNNQHFWEKWLAENPYKRAEIFQAASIIHAIKYRETVSLKDSDYIDLFEKIIKNGQVNDSVSDETKWGSRIWKNFSFFKIAASFLLVICFFIGFRFVNKKSDFSLEGNSPISFLEKVIPPGTKSVFILEDGTKVHLNSGSTIKYPSIFDEDQRIVMLSGEGFFEVKPETRPFKVITNTATIEVLGTSFNVKIIPGRDLFVALVSGKVKVNDLGGNQIMLNPKEMLTINWNGEFLKSPFDSLLITGWKDKQLVFKNSSLVELEEILESWYAVQIEFEGEFPANWSYTGTYDNEILENVLEGISQTSKVNYLIEGSSVKIYNQ